MAWVGQRVIMDLRNKMFSHLIGLQLRFFHENKSGELISKVTNDIALMEMAVSRVLGVLVLKLFTLFPPLIAVFYISWKLAIISFLALPFILYPIMKFAQRLKKISTSGQQQMANITSTMSESFYGINVIKAFNMEKVEEKRFSKFNREYYNALMKAARISALSSPLMEMIGAISAAIVFGIGLRMLISGTISQGSLMAFVASLFLMYNPVKVLSKLNYDIQRAIAGAERVFEVLDTTSKIQDKRNAVDLTTVDSKIEFKDLSFGYNPDEPVLHNINLSISPGETVAIVGVSGVGKSTMLTLIPRFYDPDEGEILIDDFNIKDVTQKSLRENIGIVTQETILFNDSIFTNITYGRNDFKQSEVESAAKAAFAHNFIMSFSNGYDTEIGDRGVTLSGGQRQRIAIARALLKDPPILILDEATSSLDSESEILIQKALEQLITNRTTIVVAHRLSTIRNSDRIVVLDKGRIVEVGQHENLLAKNGVYTNLYNMQFSELNNG